jgi:hypothetical protein
MCPAADAEPRVVVWLIASREGVRGAATVMTTRSASASVTWLLGDRRARITHHSTTAAPRVSTSPCYSRMNWTFGARRAVSVHSSATGKR